MKRIVIDFNVNMVGGDVHVDIKTDRKNPHEYRIWADDRHPDINQIAAHLQAGLALAKSTKAKVDITEYFERMYVFIVTPIKYHSDQYSAAKR